MSKEITDKDIEAMYELQKRWQIVIVADISNPDYWAMMTRGGIPDPEVIKFLEILVRSIRREYRARAREALKKRMVVN